MVAGYYSNKFATAELWLVIAMNVAIGLIFTLLEIGLVKISLDVSFGQKGEFSDLFSQAHLILKYLAGKILYTLIVAVGLVLLIVPGVIWAIKFRFFPYFIVDKEIGPIQALKESARITEGAKMDLLLLFILCGIILAAGAALVGLGLFMAIPVTLIAVAFTYHKLSASGAEIVVL